MESNDSLAAGPSSKPSVSLSPEISRGRVPRDGNLSATSIESDDEGYEELYAELRRFEQGKGKGVDRIPSIEREPSSRRTRATRETQPSSPKQQKSSSSWSDFDLSIVVALVSPIGNWLTGSDHIKNLFLIAFLIFYLHQLIEVPWKLYNASRPRSPADHPKRSESSEDSDRVARLAASELRTRELFFLTLTVLSPLAGAYLVRYILATLEGIDNISWFSTTLFVLATGIRPWSHLIERFSKRTQDLHDAVHYPSADSHVHQQGQVDERLDRILDRLDTMDLVINELRTKVSTLEPLREVCDDLSEAIGDVERSLLRHDRKIESARVSHETQLSTLEASLLRLEERHRQDRDILEDQAILLPHGREVSGFIQTITAYTTRLSRRVCNIVIPYLPLRLSASPKSTPTVTFASPSQSVNEEPDSPGRDDLNQHFSTRLETIPEAEDSDSDGTFVSGEDTIAPASPPTRLLHTILKRSRSASPPASRKAHRMSVLGSLWAVALWPWHVAIWMLLGIFSPVRRILL